MADFFFVSEPYDVDGKRGVEVAVFDGDDELVFQDIPNPSVVRDKKADRIGIFSKDKSTGVSVSLPPKKKAKVAPETTLFHTVNGSTKSVDQVSPAFATAVKKTLKSKSKKLLDESIEVSVKKGGGKKPLSSEIPEERVNELRAALNDIRENERRGKVIGDYDRRVRDDEAKAWYNEERDRRLAEQDAAAKRMAALPKYTGLSFFEAREKGLLEPKKSGSRLNEKGGRTKRNRRGRKGSQTRKLAARRR